MTWLDPRAVNQIICCHCVPGMQDLPDNCIPLTVTSPPYDGLRTYGGHPFDYRPVADQLWRVTAPGGVTVWVVRDAIVNGSETGTSSEQKLYFRDLGFQIHHSMVMHKPGAIGTGPTRYGTSLEYAFIFSKGRPRTINLLRDWPTKAPGRSRSFNYRNSDGGFFPPRPFVIGRYRRRGPIWSYATGQHTASEAWVRKAHPALMQEGMARDMIVSWSRPGDLVFDPMCGLATTCKMALVNHRNYLGMEIFREYADLARKRVRDAHQEYRKELSRWLFDISVSQPSNP